VTPGERLILRGFAMLDPSNVDIIGLMHDANEDGTLSGCPTRTLTVRMQDSSQNFDPDATYLSRSSKLADPFLAHLLHPRRVSRVRVGVYHGDTTDEYPLLRPAGVVRSTTYYNDSSLDGPTVDRDLDGTDDGSYRTCTTNCLINDPGDRNIIVTGHSWVDQRDRPSDLAGLPCGAGLGRRTGGPFRARLGRADQNYGHWRTHPRDDAHEISTMMSRSGTRSMSSW